MISSDKEYDHRCYYSSENPSQPAAKLLTYGRSGGDYRYLNQTPYKLTPCTALWPLAVRLLVGIDFHVIDLGIGVEIGEFAAFLVHINIINDGGGGIDIRQLGII